MAADHDGRCGRPACGPRADDGCLCRTGGVAGARSSAPCCADCSATRCKAARRFLRDLERACPMRIRTILTERAIEGAIGSSPRASGKEFTNRLFGLRKRAATGAHEFDTLCTALDIEHRLVRGFARSGLKRSTGAFPRRPSPPPKSPQTNVPPLGDCMQSPAGQRVARFNGRIEEVLQSHHFRSGEELEATLHRYV